jgi:hypothetical protein
MEGKEWVWENGIIREREMEQYKQQIKESKRKELEETKLEIFKSFLSKL